MTDKINDGGPAFPMPDLQFQAAAEMVEAIASPSLQERAADRLAEAGRGMTLRDYFAGQALVGCFNFWVQVHARATIGDPDPVEITKLAYEYADHMLKARQP